MQEDLVNVSPEKIDWIKNQIVELKTIQNIANEKLDNLLKTVEIIANNLSHPSSGVNNEVFNGNSKSEPQSQPECQDSEQMSDVISVKGPITGLNYENNSKALETQESTASADEGSVWEPSQGSQNETQSQNVENINGKFNTMEKWRKECLKLVEIISKCEFSKEFRQPVDLLKYTDYSVKVQTAMDLGTVKEQLCSGYYKNLSEFKEDMERIIQNSKTYNTYEKSKIYRDTLKFEKKYNKLIDPIVKKNSPTKRKRISHTESDENTEDDVASFTKQKGDNSGDGEDDSDRSVELPKKRKRVEKIDEAGPSNHHKVESRKRKVKKRTSPRKNAQFNSPNKRKVQAPTYKEESTESSSDQTSSESESYSENSTYETNGDDDDSWADLSETEKERREEIAKNIPLTTLSDELEERLKSNINVPITGKVTDKTGLNSVPVDKKKKDLNLFTFLIEINGGKQIYCKAWGDQADKYHKQIRLNQIICIEKAATVDGTLYNEGNVTFELGIRAYTKITDKIKEKRLG